MRLTILYSALCLTLALTSCNNNAGMSSHSEAAMHLISTLQTASEEGRFFYGHQDALMYGHNWKLEADETAYDRSDVFEVCGEYAAILGYDLGEIELGGDKNLDGNSFEQMYQAAVKHHERGGILTFSWHPRNPLTGGDAWDVSSDQVVKSILPGGEKHEMYMGWLKIAADYLSRFDFPIIFRPLHENSGSWFWWGAGLCTPEQYIQLWQMIYNYFVIERGLNNLVWAYSPNGILNASQYMLTYPGDEYVDIMGFDYYCRSAEFINDMRSQMETLLPLCQEHGKILAVSETGYEGIPDADWWTNQLLPACEGFPIAYVLTWRNAWDQETHFFGPWKGAECETDFVEFYNSDKTIFTK